MACLFVLLGITIGVASVLYYNYVDSETHGVIYVDHDNQICTVHMESEKLVNSNIKKAKFKIVHNHTR